ncbi:MAG: histidine phosphatase family protein [Bacteroidota bacterium]
MELLVVRHTTPFVKEGICYGQTDLPLANTFLEEFDEVKSKIPNRTRSEYVFSSPLKRCSYLASALSDHVVYDSSLKEMNFGDWEMQAWNDINQEHLSVWMNDFVNVRCPGGENYKDVVYRSKTFLDKVITEKLERAIVVTHAGVIRAFMTIIDKIEPAETFRTKIEYGEVIKFELSYQI